MKSRSFQYDAVLCLVMAIACGAVSGCASLGQRLAPAKLAPGAPEVAEVLHDLSENDSRLENFRAATSLTIQSPKLEAIEQFPTGMVAYRKPSGLHVEGRVRFNVIAFKLTCIGREFLLEFPTKRDEDRYYYQLNGEKIENVAFSVSPSDVAREMFFPEEWGKLTPQDVRITAYDPGSQEATIKIGSAKNPRRELKVQGPPWVVISNVRLDEHGQPLAQTTLKDYHRQDDVLFPAYVDAYFPGQETRMTMEMRNVRVNKELDESLFRITWRPGNHDQSLRTNPG